MALATADLLQLYYFLRLTRALEDRVIKLYRQGKVVGGCYVGAGEEAIAVGSAYALGPEDVVAPTHRDLGVYLVRGITPKAYFAQYLGRRTGLTRGKDGNVHYGALDLGILGFISPMAAGIPVAVGAALAFKIRRKPPIAVAYFGDGATSRGDFHEGVNLAAVLKLPVIFICHNNQYAYSVPLERQMAVPHVVDRAAAYNLPREIVDGNDVVAVYQATVKAAEHARSGAGPYFLECKTMRMRGHAEHDDASYVPPDLLAEWRRKDPIDRFLNVLEAAGIDATDRQQVEARIAREVDEAVAFAEQSPWPEGLETLEGVFAD
ncbi:MAG: thiamine pyrophosphate-dependent dehydrogenase E1 component subunit alpha [Candidatus Methylomirabilales bacterium]